MAMAPFIYNKKVVLYLYMLCIVFTSKAMAGGAPFIYRVKMQGIKQYDDTGSHAHEDLSVWKPMMKGCLSQYGGQLPVAGYMNEKSTMAFRFFKEIDAVAVGSGNEWWKIVWTDAGSRRPDDYTVWAIREEKIPSGYSCLSPAFFKKDRGRQPPTPSEVDGQVLVKSEYINFVSGDKLVHVWNDRGSGAHQDVTIFTGPDGFGAFASPNYNPTPSGLFPLLDLSKGAQVLS